MGQQTVNIIMKYGQIRCFELLRSGSIFYVIVTVNQHIIRFVLIDIAINIRVINMIWQETMSAIFVSNILNLKLLILSQLIVIPLNQNSDFCCFFNEIVHSGACCFHVALNTLFKSFSVDFKKLFEDLGLFCKRMFDQILKMVLD